STPQFLGFYRDTLSFTTLKFVLGDGITPYETGFTPVVSTWYVLTAIVLSSTSVYWSIAASENATPLASSTLTVPTITDASLLKFRISVTTYTTAVRNSSLDYVLVTPPVRS